jgi:hypothetical protein
MQHHNSADHKGVIEQAASQPTQSFIIYELKTVNTFVAGKFTSNKNVAKQ